MGTYSIVRTPAREADMFWLVALAIGAANGLLLLVYKWLGLMRLDRYWLVVAFVMAPFSWALCVAFLLDYFYGLPSSQDTLTTGKVFMRQRGKDAWGLEHPELTIQVEGGNEMVKANLIGDPPEKIPEQVSFYYSGDPAREVRLREESTGKLIGSALFLLLAPVAIALVLAVIERNMRRVALAPVPAT